MELEEKERVNKAHDWKVIYPDAVIPEDLPLMRTKGEYKDGFAKGATVHFTAGWNNRTVESSMSSGLSNGYCYITILADGTVVQNFDLARWGYHAGKSEWPGLGSSLSSKLIGIEVCCGGRLKKVGNEYKTWFGKVVPAHQRRWVEKGANILRDGMYEKYTEAQEKSLIKLLLWFEKNGKGIFKLDYVLGHDEHSPNRKNDPGGSLSLTMPKFRELLKYLSANSSTPIEEIEEDVVTVIPKKIWNPSIFYSKMNNLLADPTQARITDMKDIVYPALKKRINDLLKGE